MTSWQLYWLTRMDGIINVGIPFMIFGVIGTITAGIVYATAKANDDKGVEKGSKLALKFAIPVLIFGIITQVFIPSVKELAAIILVPRLTQAVVANEELKKLPNNLLNLANEWIEELKPGKEEKK